jgi:hypothetical protein
MASLLAASLLIAGQLTAWLAVGPAASAATSPIAARSASTVTADALPTAQINGVVWSQAVLGDTVYAGGSFTAARPAGVAVGGTGTVTRNNLMAYSLSTGALNASFTPDLNGQVKAVAVSPDGTRLYVGGAFTTANNANRYRLAAYDTATGLLVATFAPILSTVVNTIVATNSTVYVGGQFTTANGVTRNRAAAFSATNGALLAWDPNADYNVNTMVLAPDGTKLILGGAFKNAGGVPSYGMAAVDATSGAHLSWAANQTVRDAGTEAAIEKLITDGTAIYGVGYAAGPGGNLEGAFSADPATGNINWIEDCHGDSYSAYAVNDIVYTVSHAHYCGNIGGFPQTGPWTYHHALAFTRQATGLIGHDPFTPTYKDWYGWTSPSLINWFPDLTDGTYTGQSQAAWDVTGNSQYVVMGGEFPSVNGTAQQGLVRFAVSTIAPNAQKPMLTGANYKPIPVPVAVGSVRVSFPANWDRDDLTLSYKVTRNGNNTTPVFTTTANSTFWNRPIISFTETGLTPGLTYGYRLFVTDSSGNQIAGDTATITVPSAATYGWDTFTRKISNGWTSADLGGGWNLSGGATNFSVDGNVAKVNIPSAGAGPSAVLTGFSQSNTDVLIDTSVGTAATGDGTYVELMSRYSGTNHYRLTEHFVADGTVQLILSKVVSDAETVLTTVSITGVTYTPGDVYRLRFIVSGSGTTTLTGKIWKVGTTEPTTAQISVTDTDPNLQGAGRFGITSYLAANSTTAPVIAKYDNLSVTTTP